MQHEGVALSAHDSGQQRGYERHRTSTDNLIPQIFGRIGCLLYREDHAVLNRQKIEQPVDRKAHGLDFAPDFVEAHLVKR